MFCIYCKNERIENEAPCVYCGAPSPLAEETRYRQDEIYGQGQPQPSLLPVPYQGGGMQQADYEWYEAQERRRVWSCCKSERPNRLAVAKSADARSWSPIFKYAWPRK